MRRILAEGVDADLVAGTLYQGSAPVPTTALKRAVDVICFAAWEYQPPRWWRTVQVLRAHLDDSGLPMTRDEKSQAVRTAKRVRDALDKGKVVLVSCHSGLNRSGLICAIALMMPSMRLSKTPTNLAADQAIRAVRAARGPRALSNDYFVDFVESMNAFRSLCGPTW